MLKTLTLADGQTIRVGPMFVEDLRVGHPVFRIVNERPQPIGVLYGIPAEVSNDDLGAVIGWLLAEAALVAGRMAESAELYTFRASYPEVAAARLSGERTGPCLVCRKTTNRLVPDPCDIAMLSEPTLVFLCSDNCEAEWELNV